MPISQIVSNSLGSALTFTGQQTIPTINLTGGQITFPATQVPSANANTLDDYEEGTWTPQFGFTSINSTGVTYGSSNAGYYTKVGQMVTVTFVLNVTNKGSASGSAILGNLPFPCINNQGARGGVAIGYTTGLTVNNPNLMLDAGATFMIFRNPNGADMTQTAFSTSFLVYASYSYFTS